MWLCTHGDGFAGMKEPGMTRLTVTVHQKAKLSATPMNMPLNIQFCIPTNISLVNMSTPLLQHLRFKNATSVKMVNPSTINLTKIRHILELVEHICDLIVCVIINNEPSQHHRSEWVGYSWRW